MSTILSDNETACAAAGDLHFHIVTQGIPPRPIKVHHAGNNIGVMLTCTRDEALIYAELERSHLKRVQLREALTAETEARLAVEAERDKLRVEVDAHARGSHSRRIGKG